MENTESKVDEISQKTKHTTSTVQIKQKKKSIQKFNFKKVYITTLANAGILIKYKKTKILIDGLQYSKGGIYAVPDENTLNDMIASKGIFDRLDIMMFTHEHPDHFNPKMCNEALEQNPNLQIVGTPKVIDYIKKAENFNENDLPRLWPVQAAKSANVSLNICGVNITTCGFSHDQHEKDCEINNAYLINIANKNILHIGDAKCDVDEFDKAECLKKDINAMFVPFTYVGSKDGRQIIQICNPQKLFVNHLPDQDKDQNKWNEKAKMAHEQHAEELPMTVFADMKGQEHII